MSCLSKHGLALHIGVCENRNLTRRKRVGSQLGNTDLARAAVQSRSACVTRPRAAAPHRAGFDDYVLLAGKWNLQLPQPAPLPANWAARRDKHIVYKRSEQVLDLENEFIKNQQQGRSARKDTLLVLQEVNQLGPQLTEQQYKSHFSIPAKKWRQNSDLVISRNEETRRKVEVIRQRVALVAQDVELREQVSATAVLDRYLNDEDMGDLVQDEVEAVGDGDDTEELSAEAMLAEIDAASVDGSSGEHQNQEE